MWKARERREGKPHRAVQHYPTWNSQLPHLALTLNFFSDISTLETQALQRQPT